MRVSTVLCPFWCPFKYSKKDKNLESISDLTESLSNMAAEENPGVKKAGKEPSVHNLPSATGQNLFL